MTHSRDHSALALDAHVTLGIEEADPRGSRPVIGPAGNTAVLDAGVASGPIAGHAAGIRDQVASEGRTTRALRSPSD